MQMKPISVEIPGRNKLEKSYGQYLATLKRAGEIVDFRYEPFSLRIGHSAWYKPDFLVVKEDCFDFILESVGVYSNKEIICKACNIIKDKLTNIIQNINIKKKENNESFENGNDKSLEQSILKKIKTN